MHPEARIFIVDDHPVFRKGLGQLINEEPDMTVCGEADDVNEARRGIASLRPDMVIIDITLKDKSGLELLADLNHRFRDIRTLVVSMHDESLYAERALSAGAGGYIMKEEMTSRIIHAIRHVLSGKIYVSDAIVTQLLGKRHMPDSPANPMSTLSGREFEVFQLIGKGYRRKEIAELLGVSVKTIGTYKDLIKKKLDLKNSAELMRCAVEWNHPPNTGYKTE